MYLKRCYWVRSHLPPMKGTKGFGFPTSRHWGRARQITSGLKIGKSCFKGNSTLRGGTQPGEGSQINGQVLKLAPAKSFHTGMKVS